MNLHLNALYRRLLRLRVVHDLSDGQLPATLNRATSAAADVGLAVAVMSLALFVASLPARARELSQLDFRVHRQFDVLQPSNADRVAVALERFHITPEQFAGVTLACEIAFALFFTVLAVMVARHKRSSCWIRLVALTLALFGTAGPPTQNALSGDPVTGVVVHTLNFAAWTLLGLLFYLFPSGRFFPRWTRPLGIVWIVWNVGQVALAGTIIDPATWSPVVAFFTYIAWFLTGVLAQTARFREISNPLERQQAKYVFLGLTVGFSLSSAAVLPGLLWPALPEDGTLGALYVLLREPASHVFVLLVPLSFGLAILRYRLWDIDLFISRALVYVPLTAVVAGVYTASLGLFQRLLVGMTGAQGETALVLAMLIVATTLTPIKNAMQSRVDRSLKDNADGVHALRAYESQVEAVAQVLDLHHTTGRLLGLAIEATGATGGAIYLHEHGALQLVETAGTWTGGSALTVPLRNAYREVGLLALGPRQHGQPYSERERRILEEAAARVTNAVALAELLAASPTPFAVEEPVHAAV